MTDQPQETPQQAPVKKESKLSLIQKIRLIIATVLIILLGIFIYQNFNKIEIEFLGYATRIRIVVVILFSALLGSLITFILMKQRAAKRKKK